MKPTHRLDRSTLVKLMLYTAILAMEPRRKPAPVLMEQPDRTRKASRKKRGKQRGRK